MIIMMGSSWGPPIIPVTYAIRIRLSMFASYTEEKILTFIFVYRQSWPSESLTCLPLFHKVYPICQSSEKYLSIDLTPFCSKCHSNKGKNSNDKTRGPCSHYQKIRLVDSFAIIPGSLSNLVETLKEVLMKTPFIIYFHILVNGMSINMLMYSI